MSQSNIILQTDDNTTVVGIHPEKRSEQSQIKKGR